MKIIFNKIKQLEKDVNNFFMKEKYLNDLSLISNFLGKSNFDEDEIKNLKDLFEKTEIQSFTNAAYYFIKYVFFQINSEKLLDCYSDERDVKIHEYILNLFKYTRYIKEEKNENTQLASTKIAIMLQIIGIANLNSRYLKLCAKYFKNEEITLDRFILGCILLINTENNEASYLIMNILNKYYVC